MTDHLERTSNQEKEVSLIDIFRIVLKYKRLFWIIVISVTLFGTAITVLQPRHYTYIQPLQLGHYVQDGNWHFFEKKDDIIPQMKNYYLPMYIQQLEQALKNKPIPNLKYDIETDVPSGVINLSVSARQQDLSYINEINNKILQQILSQEAASVLSFRQGTEAP
jgi:hypothetical protein